MKLSKIKMKTVVIKINGIHCKSCKTLIEDVCRDIKGIKSCYVDVQTGKTLLEYNENFDFGVLRKEVEKLGQYEVEIN